MDSLSGIDMLQRIPKKYHPRYIIFITTSRDFAIEAFQMNAVHYLVKPFTKEDVFTALSRSTGTGNSRRLRPDHDSSLFNPIHRIL